MGREEETASCAEVFIWPDDARVGPTLIPGPDLKAPEAGR